MYPHERSLVEKWKDAPFALIGVNSDEDLAKLQPRLLEAHITWRNFRDHSTNGAIARAWNVHTWPTIYVLDPDGRIRAKNLRGDDLERVVGDLLASVKAAAK